jgi:O-antigen/teichoic acid export membrane protein
LAINPQRKVTYRTGQDPRASACDGPTAPTSGGKPASIRRLVQELSRGTRSQDASRLITWSLLTGLAAQAALLISGPVVARLLGVEHRGYLALFMLLPPVVTQIAHLGLPDALPFHLTGDIRRLAGIRRAIWRPLVLQTSLATCVSSLAIIPFVRGRPAEVVLAGMLSVPMIALSLAQSYGLSILSGLHQFARFQLLRLAPAVIYAVGTLYLYVVGVHSLPMVMLTWLSSQVLVVILLAAALPRVPVDSAADGPTTKTLLQFGVRGWLGTTAPIEALRPDQLVVGLFLSPSALGLYVVGIAFTNLPRFLAQSVGLVTYPRIAAERDAVLAFRLLKRHLFVTLGASGTVVVVVSVVCGTLIPKIFGQEFSAAVPVTRILLIAAIPNSIRRVLGDGLRGMGRPGAAAVAEIVTALTLLASLALLLPRWHIEGAAAALAISAVCGVTVMLAEFRRAERAVRSIDPPSMEDL